MRTVKFAKYLPECNWQPVILTMQPSAHHPQRLDPSLLEEVSPQLKVYRTPVWMLDRSLAKAKKRVLGLFSMAAKESISTVETAAGGERRQRPAALDHIRDWLQFPDDYGGWLLPALWRGYQVMKSERIDLIYSTAPSPVTHMIALILKRWARCPWVADFRDPWECLFPESVYLEGRHPWRQQAEVAMAEKVVRAADLVIANTPRLRTAFRGRFPGLAAGKFVTIPNGFDPEDFRRLPPGTSGTGKFTIAHTGTFFTTLRSPDEVLRAIQDLVNDGKINPAILCVKLVGCGTYTGPSAPYLQVVPRVSHDESLRIVAQSDVLLLLQQSAKYLLQVPAKTYEYIAARKWILAVTPEGATRDIVANLPNGVVVTPDKPEELKSAILKLYRMYLEGQLYPVPWDHDDLNRFSRRQQTHILSSYFDRLVR
ncbi:MAG TPA: glycosyltransferase [Terriglobales bacterium]|nr:glycosyltransferase [Terriglobales bacterium]